LEVRVEGRNIEKALRNLKRKLEREGLLKEIRKRKFYQKPSVRKKLKRIEARKRKSKDLKFKRKG
jgi:small subunit ribosomal protein S21